MYSYKFIGRFWITLWARLLYINVYDKNLDPILYFIKLKYSQSLKKNRSSR